MDHKQLLSSVFGYHSYRGQQQEIVENLIAGNDSIVLMPTGGGKSLCFQIPAIVRAGTAIVVSPLIALMQDQVQALQQLGVKAEFLNSSLDEAGNRRVISALMRGELDLLYVAPERLLTEYIFELLSQIEIALFAIDEAHCVSQWGHDFRPEYMNLALLHEHFPSVPRIALTATADVPTRNEIRSQLKLEEAQEFVASFDRPNISLNVVLKKSVKKQLLSFIKDNFEGESGIVYCLSRKKVEQTALFLQDEGILALPYHAGLSSAWRKGNQERFINEEGVVMVATIAFGMGIDKPNVRFVAHIDLPKSVESYYQEVGRGGRDGLPAVAWMAYGMQDVAMRRSMIGSSESSEGRKRIEQQMLTALLGYAETTECRRKVLLRYFGEELNENCNNCDTCLVPVETFDGSLAAQKALSAVFRTGQRFGASYLTDVLLGKDTDRIISFSHNQLPTFGVGSEYSATEWASIFRQLVAAGFLDVDIEGYGGLRLTEKSKLALNGDIEIQLRVDTSTKSKKRSKKKQSSASEMSTEGRMVFELLRKKRLDMAREQNVPPYVIFHDKTLMEMAETRPSALEEMSHISGVGEQKLKRYGQEFLNVLLEFS
jgi:ATP-dependent DNA helicase RecQ